jgi:hypothetical protein
MNFKVMTTLVLLAAAPTTAASADSVSQWNQNRRYEPYTFDGSAPGALADAAVATAAHDALVAAVFNPGLPFSTFPGYAGFGTPAQQATAVAQVTATWVGLMGSRKARRSDSSSSSTA